MLFLLFINDIAAIDTSVNSFLFADDAAFLLNDGDRDTLQVKCQTFLLKLSFWLDANRLCPNVTKTNYIIFSPNHLNTVEGFALTFFNTVLERRYDVKYLGITITHNLAWHKHIEKLTSKISNILCYFYKLRYVCNINTCIQIYYALIYSQLSYCCHVWGLTYPSHLEPLLKIQKKFIRIVTFSKKEAHITPFFKVFKLLKIQDVIDLSAAKYIYRVLGGLLPLTHTKFGYVRSLHGHATRAAVDELLCVPLHTSHINKYSMEISGAAIWNKLPYTTRSQVSIKMFTHEIMTACIQGYSVQ
jgi:hypothetical protein